MTLFQIVALYIALHCLLTPILMFRVGQVRIKEKINLGDGGNETLLTRIRAHGNYTENMPIALIGLIALAMLKANPIALHVFGIVFLVGRILHAMGMRPVSSGKPRLYGMMCTLFTHFGQAITLLYLIVTKTPITRKALRCDLS